MHSRPRESPHAANERMTAISRDDMIPAMSSPLRVSTTRLADPELAIRELFGALDVPELSGIVLFCSSRYPLDAINEALAASAEKRDLSGVIIPNAPAAKSSAPATDAAGAV